MTPDPIRIEARFLDGRTEVRLLIRHPMHTGRERDPDSGAPIPALYIDTLIVERIAADGRTHELLQADFGPGIARNPFHHFAFGGGAPGETVRVRWRDSGGNEASGQTVITA